MRKVYLRFISVFLCLFALPIFVFAHEGHDHGESEPETTTNAQGIISLTKSIGEVELLVKHLPFTPDTANSGRLFLSHFDTNEAITDISPKVEIVDQTGNAHEITVKKNETNGGFDLEIPPVVQGKADFRITFKHAGKTETVSFGNISIAPKAEISPLGTSYFVFALWLAVLALLLAMFCALAYAVWQSANRIKSNTVEIKENSVVAEV